MTRNEQIKELFLCGNSMAEIGRKFYLTRSRIRQILKDDFGLTKKSGYKPITNHIDFWKRVAITADENKCWLWQGAYYARGYGQLRYGGKLQYAHRISYYFSTGKFPTQCVLHSCDNPPCVNPNHLREGTHRENMDDAVKRGRMRPKLHKNLYMLITGMLVSGKRIPEIALALDISDVPIYRIKKILEAKNFI